MPLRTKELPNVGGPASFVLLSSRSAPVLPLRLYCLSIVCPLGLPGSAPARMLQGDSSKTFSVFPTHTVWTIPTPQCLSLEHPRTCPTEPYGLALTLRLCTCTCAVPAQTCSAPSGLVAFWFTVMCPHSSPGQAPPPGPQLPSASTLAFSQSSSTLGRPQLQAKPFLLLLTQRRISHLPSQKEEWPPSPYCLQSKRRALQSLFLKWRPEWVISEWTESSQRRWLSQGGDQQAAAARSEGWWSVGFLHKSKGFRLQVCGTDVLISRVLERPCGILLMLWDRCASFAVPCRCA